MGGPALGGGGEASEGPSAASSRTSQPAKKEAVWEGKQGMSKRKGKSSGGAPKGRSESDTE